MRSPARVVATPKTDPPGGDLDRGHRSSDDRSLSAPVEDSSDGSAQSTSDLHSASGRADSCATRGDSRPKPETSRNGGDHIVADDQITGVPADNFNGNGQSASDSHYGPAVAVALNGDQSGNDAHSEPVAVEASEGGQSSCDHHGATADPSEALLVILSDALDDLEAIRVATGNRLYALREDKKLRGTRAEARLESLSAALAQLEHEWGLELKRTLRDHPLGPWVKRTVGIGEKQGARLIAAIGDPAWNGAEGRPRRGPAELWAYCGYAPGQKRRKGQRSNWNATAKMRAFLCAESVCKWNGEPDVKGRTRARSPYRDVYERARANWKMRDTTDLHKHRHALRVVAKEILKDLWREARTTGAPLPNVTASVPPR